MSLSHTFSSIFIIFFALVFLASANPCSNNFLDRISKFNITANFCSVKALKAEFGWHYNNRSRQLDIAFGAKLDGATGWIAWGLNPDGPHMVGTRALIGLKRRDRSLDMHMYNITYATKMGCQLQPSQNIGFNVTKSEFFPIVSLGYYVIHATVVLPEEYNASKINVVWQTGDAITDTGPLTHRMSLENFDAAEVLDLVSNEVVSYTAKQLLQFRVAHGILNIGGWGTLLPIGVIAARYFRSFPIQSRKWFMLHVTIQIFGYTIGLMGWATGLWLGNNSKYYVCSTHRTMAIIIFSFTTIQMLSLRLKPKYDDDYRDYWNMYHHFLGYSMLTLICVNIFYGIKILQARAAWKWTYLGLLMAIGLVATGFETFTWFKFCSDKNSRKGLGAQSDQNSTVIDLTRGKKSSSGTESAGVPNPTGQKPYAVKPMTTGSPPLQK